MEDYLKLLDYVIDISGSGNSRNVVKAIKYANSAGVKTFGITGHDSGELSKVAHSNIAVKINDMQKVEDVHIILVHLTMQIILYRLNKGKDGNSLYKH